MTVWVLLRRGLLFHVLAQAAPDLHSGTAGLYGQQTLCGLTTPTERDDILQYSEARPRPVIAQCITCTRIACPEPSHEVTMANIHARADKVRTDLLQHATNLRADLAATEQEIAEGEPSPVE